MLFRSGPAGVAVLIEAFTDNRNRTAADLRLAFSKHGGNLGESGCVSYLFEPRSVVRLAAGLEEEALMELLLHLEEAGGPAALGWSLEEDGSDVIGAYEDLEALQAGLREHGLQVVSWEHRWIPQTSCSLNEPEFLRQCLRLLDALEGLDDVRSVATNLEADPAAMDASHIYAPAGTRAPFAMADGSSVPHALLMGGDSLGRDIWSRVVYGTRVSLLVGLFTAIVALVLGVIAGTVAGYFRRADAILMRFMDGLMAIPAILLAIALVAALGAKVWTVVVAIAIPEVPRVTRLVRSLVLTLREEPFVEAARALATPTPVILMRHILPNAMAPMIVQGTFIAASAVLTEAILS